MKVSVNDFELRLMPFMMQIADTMPTSLHKWLGGAMIATSAGKIDGFVRSLADADGMVDLDNVRKLIDSGFTASGGEVVIPFGSDALSAFGVKPVNVKIAKADADRFLAGFGA